MSTSEQLRENMAQKIGFAESAYTVHKEHEKLLAEEKASKLEAILVCRRCSFGVVEHMTQIRHTRRLRSRLKARVVEEVNLVNSMQTLWTRWKAVEPVAAGKQKHIFVSHVGTSLTECIDAVRVAKAVVTALWAFCAGLWVWDAVNDPCIL